MKRATAIISLVLLSSPAFGDVVTERWSAGAGRHADSAAFTAPDGGGTLVKFDLSALPKGARIYRARLLPGMGPDGFPQAQPLIVKPLTKPCAEKETPAVEDKALALAGPRFASFDATDLVTRWASGKLDNNGLLIRGPKIANPKVALEITYEGQLKDPPAPVTDLKCFYRAGQVFMTWKEIDNKFFGQKDLTWKEYTSEQARLRGQPNISYRIYRHSQPITAKNLGEAELLDEVGQFTCLDPRQVKTEWKGEAIKNVKVDDARVPRTAIQPREELPVGVGVFVKTTAKDGNYYYAVVSAIGGVENTTALDAGNTSQAIAEKVAPTEPILFAEEQLQYQQDRSLFCYVWWVEEPLNNLPNFIHMGVTAGPKLGNPARQGDAVASPAAAAAPAGDQAKQLEELVKQLGSEDAKLQQEAEDALVKAGAPAVAAIEAAMKTGTAWGQVPKLAADASEADKARAAAAKDKIAEARRAAALTIVKIRVANYDAAPAPLIVHGYWWSGGWNTVHPCPQEDGVTLQLDDHPWQARGIHEGNGTLKAYSQGKVQNYYIRQIKALLPWVQAKYHIDMERIYAFSGDWAWHYPELFAATFEVLTTNPKRSPAMPEARRYWNDPKNAPETEWGMSPYEYWNAGEWIKNNPKAELAHMSYTPYQHTGDFGRLDKPAFYAAMRDTRHAFACTFDESRGWYGTYDAGWIFQIRKSDSIAAFTNCTLDDNPGIGAGGDPGGQINAWVAFDARSQADQSDKWEMTVYLLSADKTIRQGAPLESCTADVTPRRCQKFKANPGDKFAWTNTSLKDNTVVQSGKAVADANGLVTAEKVVITKGKNRLSIQREK